MNKKFYITTSIPYVNADPHIGFALETIEVDVISRYRRILGDDVRSLTGTDENALKNVQAAEKVGAQVKDFIDERAKNFSRLKALLNLTYDDFIRTTEERHVRGAQKLWNNTKKEDIYKKTYKGLYCIGCEQFYEKEELTDNGECVEHPGKKVEEVEEENYFFRLSKYQSFLEDLVEKDVIKIIPEIRKNEVLAFIKRGLNDFSISRSNIRAKGWGISVPEDDSQKIYVWYDALANYITALDYDSEGELYRKFWLNNQNRIHVIGKGITRFHAIYWPAMLESANIPLPTTIFVHGYVTSGGQKISKSLGNVIDPFEQVQEYGTDAVRYFLLREIPSYGDGDYTDSRFREVYNADLANGLGNLVARVAKLAEIGGWDTKELIIDRPNTKFDEVKIQLDKFKFDSALEYLWGCIKGLDAYLEKERPWDSTLTKFLVVQEAVTSVKEIAYVLQPFIPETANKILVQFGGNKIRTASALFPRLT
jgi:methionyl-tRNA synthetase